MIFKLYFLDTGLLCLLLRIHKAEELNFHAARGAIFEFFVLSELIKRKYHSGMNVDLSFWRDSTGHEVDCIIECGNTVVPVEIKSGLTVNRDYFKGLSYWLDLAKNKEKSPAAIIYGGKTTTIRNDVHIYSWWNF